MRHGEDIELPAQRKLQPLEARDGQLADNRVDEDERARRRSGDRGRAARAARVDREELAAVDVVGALPQHDPRRRVAHGHRHVRYHHVIKHRRRAANRRVGCVAGGWRAPRRGV
eukprot:4562801-Prymnesium_polylepis.1